MFAMFALFLVSLAFQVAPRVVSQLLMPVVCVFINTHLAYLIFLDLVLLWVTIGQQ